MVPIEKGVPIPAIKMPGKPRKYPWPEMAVGDSFLMSANGGSGGMVSGANKKYATKHFVSRKTAEGYRVWRTA